MGVAALCTPPEGRLRSQWSSAVRTGSRGCKEGEVCGGGSNLGVFLEEEAYLRLQGRRGLDKQEGKQEDT